MPATRLNLQPPPLPSLFRRTSNISSCLHCNIVSRLCFIFFRLLTFTLTCYCPFFSTRPPQRNVLVPLSVRLTLDRLPLIKPVQATCGV